jgi:hypothetical protein
MLTFNPSSGDSLTVMLDKRCLGFIKLFTISGESAWRFLRRSGDDPRFPIPAPKHATREDAVEYVKRQVGE